MENLLRDNKVISIYSCALILIFLFPPTLLKLCNLKGCVEIWDGYQFIFNLAPTNVMNFNVIIIEIVIASLIFFFGLNSKSLVSKN